MSDFESIQLKRVGETEDKWPLLEADKDNQLSISKTNKLKLSGEAQETELEVSGTVKAARFTGDGSQLSGLPSSSDKVSKAGDTMTGSLTVNGTVTAASFIGDGSKLKGLPSSSDKVSKAGDTMTGSLTVNGTVTATSFTGDGSKLTGLPSSSDKVSKAGDTMTGSLTINNNGDLLLKASGEDPGDIVFQNSSGKEKGRIWSNPQAGSGLYLRSGNGSININESGNVEVGGSLSVSGNVNITSKDSRLTVDTVIVRCLKIQGPDTNDFLTIAHDGKNWMFKSEKNGEQGYMYLVRGVNKEAPNMLRYKP